jgi:hypothetical protein
VQNELRQPSLPEMSKEVVYREGKIVGQKRKDIKERQDKGKLKSSIFPTPYFM